MIDPQRHETIKRRLKQRGTSLAQVARDLEVLPSTVSIVSQGHRKSDRIQRAIALRLDTTAEALFPEKYSKEDVA
ncbi:Nlp family transcriptional regulator [Palleronia aestuarii]|uniref:Nlp family transcriptional regulator n=1 Tax=Palleronia aestuarii TaxID=568105 RepID=A0A2W7MSW6_9RHOB|nr:helix-turn-helix domain-containing protein [Palleronia aestuarii]PZX10950.1 Nlp family transcriptional regulator [Palleronia aestuarii]